MAKLVEQPDNPLHGFTLAAEDGVDPSVCGQTLHAHTVNDDSLLHLPGPNTVRIARGGNKSPLSV